MDNTQLGLFRLVDYPTQMAVEAEIELSLADLYDGINDVKELVRDLEGAAANACVNKANAYARMGSALDLGLGSVWDGRPGTASGFHRMAGVVWISGRLNLSNPDPMAPADALSYWMLGASLRASWHETVATGNKTTPNIEANVINVWGGVEHYSETWSFAARGGYLDSQAVTASQRPLSTSGVRWLLTASMKLQDALSQLLPTLLTSLDSTQPTNGAWLNVSYGTASGTISTLDDKAFLISLSFSPTPPNIFNEQALSNPQSGASGGHTP